MNKQRNTQIIVIIVLSLAILIMSVGFAVFTETLTFTGNTGLSGASWGIAFDASSYTESEGSVNVTAANRTITGTSMAYTVNLEKPGDFYEFTINVKNKGTFNVNLTSLVMSGVPAANQKYLTYEIVYNGTTYTSTNEGLNVALASAGTAPVKVKVAYVQPENSADLPAEDVNVNLTASLTYTQSN